MSTARRLQPIPADKDRRCFAVQRRISREMRGQFSFLETPGSNLIKAERWGKLAVTLIKKGEIIGARQSSVRLGSMLFPDLVNLVLNPPLAEFDSNSVFDVQGADVLPQSSTVFMRLADPERRLSQQRDKYIHRLRNSGASMHLSRMIPGVAIATLLDDRAKAEVIDWVAEQLPSTVMLTPATTFPEVPD